MSAEAEQEKKETLAEYLEKAGFAKKGDTVDMSALMDQIRKFSVNEVKDHACGGEGCPVCDMKKQIDSQGFQRGLEKGIRVGQRYPEVTFNDS